jgi:two-component system OmpR family sensor kinase
MATTVAGLITVVCLLLAAVSTLAVRSFLLARVDGELNAAVGRTTRASGDEPGFPGGPPPDQRDSGNPYFFPPGQAAGTLSGVTRRGHTVAFILSDENSSQPERLDAEDATALASVPATGAHTTVDLGHDEGRYRVAAIRTPDGDVLLTGLPLSGIDATINRLLGFEAGLTLAAALLTSAAGSLLVRRILAPLDRVAVTASRVAGLPLDSGEVDLAERVRPADADPRTETGQLGAAFNAMLDNVASALAARHRSESRVRQFVADASHELRTPLTAIRGYAELNRRAEAKLSPDLAYAAERIESEAMRMSMLVDDLLLLARLDSGRRLEHREVDLTRLVVDAVNDAQVAGRAHSWRLDVPAAVLMVPGDPARLHQVVANVLANARVHTPPGTVVLTRLAVEGAVARLEICDNGPGVAAELQPQVFERFTRADSSRSRAAGSTGLGLSIVSAVVSAHSGDVSLESSPGRTCVTITLPLAPAELSDGTYGRHHEHAVSTEMQDNADAWHGGLERL